MVRIPTTTTLQGTMSYADYFSYGIALVAGIFLTITFIGIKEIIQTEALRKKKLKNEMPFGKCPLCSSLWVPDGNAGHCSLCTITGPRQGIDAAMSWPPEPIKRFHAPRRKRVTIRDYDAE